MRGAEQGTMAINQQGLGAVGKRGCDKSISLCNAVGYLKRVIGFGILDKLTHRKILKPFMYGP